ncbi:GntR family transcriptional regulator [Mycolicibacterium holsaticum]|uniref:GntR family transcriptional regulator n=1 Tax=Mycolicibacterium holsaticum TaxID=152142 RepID=A0A1E3RX17_9MYCO|nr:GntR family transcriptional regulator [Mycolicibacterium holsaticum]QZA13890.1 FadR family transcriptional regulator [Mycolicibacterium holsaticum DSM 44478 = JCM 12374]UNC08650.1 FadR family transcriptional regulator [Mycolicibacterium holsaticum DSM 44478 = JCM 12374]
MGTKEKQSPTFSATVVKRPRHQVEEQIRHAIRSGALVTGQKLPTEIELAADFGVSRTTIREALRTLVADGLLEKMPGAGGGSFVRSLDHHAFGADVGEYIENMLRVGSVDYREVAEVRRMLEVPSVRLATLNRSQADLDELNDVLEEEKALTFDDPAVPELDVRFHSTISKASGNRVAAAFVSALHQVTEPVHHLKLSAEVGKRTFRQHVEIVRAIEKGDASEAEMAMREHLSYLEEHSTKDG